jgi:hypothetical protein
MTETTRPIDFQKRSKIIARRTSAHQERTIIPPRISYVPEGEKAKITPFPLTRKILIRSEDAFVAQASRLHENKDAPAKEISLFVDKIIQTLENGPHTNEFKRELFQSLSIAAIHKNTPESDLFKIIQAGQIKGVLNQDSVRANIMYVSILNHIQFVRDPTPSEELKSNIKEVKNLIAYRNPGFSSSNKT